MSLPPLILALGLLPFSNGHGVARYDVDAGRVDSLRPALYARLDADTTTPELMGALYFGLRAGGANAWLPDRPIDEAGYLPGTGIARVTQSFGDLEATQYFFAAYDGRAPHLFAVVEVTNRGAAPLADAAVFSLQDVRAGGTETLAWVGDAFEERGDAGLLLHAPLGGTPRRHAVDPRAAVDAGDRLSNTDDAGPAADLVAGFEWDLAGLDPGESRVVGILIGVAADGDRMLLDLALSPATIQGPEQMLAAAQLDWEQFQARAAVPRSLSDDEERVYRQSLATLRMAQVREAGPPHGQIVAGIDEAERGRTWVRDQAYAVRALVRAGLFDEARDALDFLMRGRASSYELDLKGPYALSVLRYLGGGDEETDTDADGPVVGLDGFGLTLAALDDYASASGDATLLEDHRDRILVLIGDVLMQQIDIDDSLLVRDDNSIWNGERRKYTFTQAATVMGLRAGERIAERLGDADRAGQYGISADLYTGSISDRVVDRDSLRLNSAFQTDRGVLDGAVVEAFNWDVLPADGEVALATLDQLRAGLAAGGGPGYVRNDEGDALESTFVDLRLATAARRAGRPDHAAELLLRVTDRARANADLIASDHAGGGIASAGLGAGAYVLALWEREDAGGGGSDGGCGCRAGVGSPPGAAALALAALIALAPRRRKR